MRPYLNLFWGAFGRGLVREIALGRAGAAVALSFGAMAARGMDIALCLGVGTLQEGL